MTTFELLDPVQRVAAELTATAESPDGLVAATAGPHGQVRALYLDPRLYRTRDPVALAHSVLAAVLAATEAAAREVFDLVVDLLPAPADPADTDLSIDPLLRELDLLIASHPAPGRPEDDALPRLGDGIDYRAQHRKLSELRATAPRLRATAESDDGLVSATVDGRGRLVALWLDARVYRTVDSRALAERIGATTLAAADAIRDRLCALTRSVWE